MKRLLGLVTVIALAVVAAGVATAPAANARVQPSSPTPKVAYMTVGGFEATLKGDWSPEAKKGNEMALKALSDQIQPKIPVTVLISLEPLAPNLLGLGGGSKAARDFDGAPMAETWYPVSLANQLANKRFSDEPDATVRLNSIMPWDYDGDPKKSLKNNKPDFVTTVMHEILHGMGVTGSVSVTDGVAEWGDDDGTLDEENHLHAMYWNGGISPFNGTKTSSFFCQAPVPTVAHTKKNSTTERDLPTIYDRYIVDGKGESVLDTDLFPDPSVELNAFLTSDDLWWNGPEGRAANGGKPFKIYAPTEWRQGSSYAHLDDPTYDGTEEALMTAAGAKIDNLKLGPRLVGLLADLGWTVSKR
jgi:hypothetical protein